MKYRVAVDSDHAGFSLRAPIIETLRRLGHRVVEVGPKRRVPGDDYPDRARSIARAIQTGRADRGILVCGSGVGACVAANKFKGIRAALCENTFSAHQGVEDDDANVLCLGARVTGEELALDIVRAFMAARFSGAARHRRRVGKLKSFEEGWPS